MRESNAETTPPHSLKIPHFPVAFPAAIPYLSVMGFYATASTCAYREKKHVSAAKPSGEDAPPSKMRVGGFSTVTQNRTLKVRSQVLDPQQGKQPSPTEITSGVHFYGYRYYNPELGRWLNRDIIAEYGGLNVYAFVGNQALGWIDILGLVACCGDPLHKEQCRREKISRDMDIMGELTKAGLKYLGVQSAGGGTILGGIGYVVGYKYGGPWGGRIGLTVAGGITVIDGIRKYIRAQRKADQALEKSEEEYQNCLKDCR